MSSTGRNGLESKGMDSKSEGCEIKSGEELNNFSKTKLSQLQLLSGGLIEMISYQLS